jgi:site-specific DNA recombinase
MKEILEGCKKRKFDVVVTLKLDRLTRSVMDLGYLVDEVFKKNRVAFSSLQDNFDTSTANGRMVMNMLGTIAQWERDIIAERTRDSMQHLRNQLVRIGEVPYGFLLSGYSLKPKVVEIEVVREMIALRK